MFEANGTSESYRPDRGAGVELARVAGLLHASAYSEHQSRAAVSEVADAVARGNGVEQQSSTSIRALAPLLALGALLPVAFLLWRRNLG